MGFGSCLHYGGQEPKFVGTEGCMNNLITRTITGIVYVVVMVLGMMRPDTIILLFALITGLTMWEYTGLVNDIDGVRVNRFISTIAGVYLVAAVALWRIGMVDFRVFLPYILTIVYMFVEELYLKQKNPINDWAYTMLGQMYVALPFSLIFFLAFQIDAMNNASFEISLFLSACSSSYGQTIRVRTVPVHCLEGISCSRVSVRERHGKAVPAVLCWY